MMYLYTLRAARPIGCEHMHSAEEAVGLCDTGLREGNSKC